VVDPGADRGDCELGRVAGDAEADPANIGADIVDAIGHELAEILVLEVVHLDPVPLSFRPPVAAAERLLGHARIDAFILWQRLGAD
jgi:hypothetical protein